MNTRNLVNEMKYNNGKIVSHQFALMRPRKNQRFEKPKDLDGEKVSKEMRKLERKVSRRDTEKQRRSQILQSEAVHNIGGTPTGSLSPKGPVQRPGTREEELGLVPLDDPSLDIEVSRLLEDPRIEIVWRTLQGAAAAEAPGLPRARTARALEALGHSNPEPRIIEESLASLAGDGPLDINEFTSIVAVFNRQRRLHLREHFKRLDDDSSGTISAREFKHLMWDLGFTVENATVQEFLADADNDNSGEVEFAEFEHACHLVHQRHGFSRKEVQDFEMLFDRYDTDGSHEMEADELASAMGWLGSPTTLDQAKAIIEKFDDDGTGTLAKPEFLMVMRNRLEEEITEMKTLFCEFDVDDSGSMDISELLELFFKLGYTITADVVEDAIKACLPHIHIERDSELVFEDVLKLFHLMRRREGFSEKELQELTDVFNRHDKMGQGELREFEFARCLNWLGYPLSQQRRRELWCRVDVDKTESIEISEFLKVIRILREEETHKAKDLLERVKRSAAKNRNLSDQAMKDLLMSLGYHPPPAIISQALKQSVDSSGDGTVDLQGILGILRFIREKQVVKLRASAGISDQQANKIRGKFSLRVEAGKQIELHEFERVMYDLFPAARASPVEREKIKTLIKDNSHGGAGLKDLMEAYWIVRLYGDMRDEDKWRREQDVANEMGFTNWQVASFREAFVVADYNSDGSLSEHEIQAVFEDLMSLNLSQFETMSKEFHKLGDKRDCIEFSDFLRLMRVILDDGKDESRPPTR